MKGLTMARKENPEVIKYREYLTNTLTKLDAAEGKMLRAVHRFEKLREAKKRYERSLAKAMVAASSTP
jgi:hypothetical protein